ncbi:MAG: GatB/YqeY domain-containing protein [Candidatus Roizmanbacteria bacterium]|nr:MAG: GatB/YqeY domain-containing protein [Candidatus Roizmanbacteria bacterium]
MLRQKLQNDQLAALKSGNKTVLETLRYILAQIINKEIDKKSELNDEEVISLLRKQNKELQESIDAFKKGAREDLARQSEEQKKIISSYLPEEISEEALKQEIEKVINVNQDVYNRDPKAIIGIVMRELKNKADPSRIMKTLKDLRSKI